MYYLLQTHFTQNQYELYRADGRKLLKWNAIPTIFNFDTPVKKSIRKRPVRKGQKKQNSKESDPSKVNVRITFSIQILILNFILT